LLLTSVSPQLPAGNWKDSARNYHLDGGVLTAELKQADGEWRTDSIKVRPGMVLHNNDGHFSTQDYVSPNDDDDDSAPVLFVCVVVACILMC
jgi:hypothetical protein